MSLFQSNIIDISIEIFREQRLGYFGDVWLYIEMGQQSETTYGLPDFRKGEMDPNSSVDGMYWTTYTYLQLPIIFSTTHLENLLHSTKPLLNEFKIPVIICSENFEKY